jgi:CysZ protein
VGFVQDVLRALQFELKKLVLLITVGIACLVLNALPGLGSAIASIGGVTLAATLVCLDFLDAPLERRRLKFSRKLGLIYSNMPATASFGLTSLFLVSIPLLNLLTVPLCVASGTLFFCDRLWPKYFQPKSESSSFKS